MLDNLIIDGKEIWNIDKFLPYRFFPEPSCSPSDSRYREDLIWLVYEDQQYAQEWKSKLEVQQRYDKKQRADFEKQRKKKKGLKFIV